MCCAQLKIKTPAANEAVTFPYSATQQLKNHRAGTNMRAEHSDSP